ncbi:hypothetical protein NC651_034496 [Populus alba x Populus x berolinensis]|nr:hypothetical protein NC651_034496 [Populus alba x Populus x berolinensis]
MLVGLIATDGKLSESCLLIINILLHCKNPLCSPSSHEMWFRSFDSAQILSIRLNF